MLLVLFQVDLPEFFCLLVCLPLVTVARSILPKLVQLWHDFTDYHEERPQDKLEEARLTFRDLSCLTVAEERYRKAFLFLHVTLVEELLKEKLGPFQGDLKGSRLCRHICSMHTQLNQDLLRVKFFLQCLIVN